MAKYLGKKQSDFTFVLRNGITLEVPYRMQQTYKECFFDESYFKGFPFPISKKGLDVVIDIGANVGYFSFSVFNINPSAKVFAYEPMPNNFALLSKYKNENPGLSFQTNNTAVGAKEGTMALNYDANDSFTTAASIFNSEHQINTLEVATTTLKQIMVQNKLEKVDFLKLDCEGSEYEILYNTPSPYFEKINMISIETHAGTEKNQNLESLIDFLNDQGFLLNTKRDQIWAWKPIRS